MVSRRRFLQWSVGAGVAALSAGRLLAHDEGEDVILGPAVPDQPLHQASPHVWFIQAPEGFPTPHNQGLMCNVTFVLGSKGVMVVDSGASVQIGQMALRQLQKLTPLPVLGIINTHYHGDHWLGNDAFVRVYGPELPIYAHPDTQAAILGSQGRLWYGLMEKATNQATSGTRIVAPNRPVGHGFRLDLGDVHLQLHHYGRAHTHADLCVEVVEDQLTCMGDVAMDKRIANMDDGSYLGTFRTYDALEKNTQTRIWHPAHGRPSAHLLTEYRALFEGIYYTCEQAIKDGQPLEAAKALVLQEPRVASRAPHIEGFEANIGKYVSIAYLEAEANAF